MPATPYLDDDYEFEKVRLKVNARLTNSVPTTREASLYDPSDVASVTTETKTRLPILYRARQQEESSVVTLASKGRYLEAAKEQGKIVKLRRRLDKHTPHTPLSAQDEALLVEQQANFLLQCHTVGRHCEAGRLLEALLEDKEYILADETNGRIKMKVGELYLAQGRLGDSEKLKLAKNALEDAATLLESLSPFPHELYLRSIKRLVRALDMLRKPSDVRSLKSYVKKKLLEDSNVELDSEINWEYDDGPESIALAWCRTQTNPALAVECPTFKFDSVTQGTTPLHLAVREGQIEVLREMLVEVERVDVRDGNGCTPLLIAAKERHSEIFKLLLDHEASIDKVDKLGQTVLHNCQSHSREGSDITIARLLYERQPALINAAELTGKTALLIACEEGNEEMVKFLLDHDADPNIPSTKNKTPLQVAVEMRSSSSTRERHANRLRIIEMLLTRAADSNQRDNLGNTPLYTAASNGDLKVVQLLLEPEYKTKVDLFGRQDQTPLAAAVQHRHGDVIKELVSSGATGM